MRAQVTGLQANFAELAVLNTDLQNIPSSTLLSLIAVDDRMRMTRSSHAAGELLEIDRSRLGESLMSIDFRPPSKSLPSMVKNVGEECAPGEAEHNAEGFKVWPRVTPILAKRVRSPPSSSSRSTRRSRKGCERACTRWGASTSTSYSRWRTAPSVCTRQVVSASTRYEHLLQTVTQVMLVVGPWGCMDTISPSSREVFGYDSQLFLGESVNKLVHPAVETHLNRVLGSYVNTGSPDVIRSTSVLRGRTGVVPV